MSNNDTDPFAHLMADQSSTNKSSGLQVKLKRYQRLLKTRWWVVFLSVSLTVCIAGWYSMSKPPKYQSTGRMMVSGQISLPGSAVYNEDNGNFFDTQIKLIESELVRTAAEASVHAMHPEIASCPVTISAAQDSRASLFLVTAIGDQPAYTQALLDAVMQEYIHEKNAMRSEKSDTTVNAIREELDNLEQKIKAGEDDLINFQRENNVNFLQAEGNSAGQYLSSLDRKLADLNTKYQLLKMLTLDQNINSRASTDAAKHDDSDDSDLTGALTGAQADYAQAKRDLQLLNAKLAERSKELRPAHPYIVKLKEDISLKKQLISIYQAQSKSQLEDQRESVRLQIENLEKERSEWRTKALDASGRTAQYESIKSKLDRLKALYDHLLSSMQAVDVNKNIDQNNVSILEKASVAAPQQFGIAKVIAAALAGGLGIGFGILMLADHLDNRVYSSEEFCSQFPDRVFGRVPKEKDKSLKLLHPSDPVFGEAFSNIRSSLLFLPREDSPLKTIVVTSAVPNEGKSTVASNLAATLAIGGSRTLLVDADLRRGEVHQLLKVSNNAGFTEVVTGQIPWREAVAPTDVENLSVIPRGKILAQPSRYFLSKTVDQFLKEAAAEYDFVVLDSCPILATDDTTSLAPKVDGTLFVVRMAFSTSATIRAAHDLLKDRQVKLLGATLNAVNAEFDNNYYYSYSSYYPSVSPLAEKEAK